MAHRGTQALREHEWQTQQRRDGYADGLSGRGDRGYSDQYYQRGLREGAKKRAGLHFTKYSAWMGNGFGQWVDHKAWIGEEQVGEFNATTWASNWAFDKRGSEVMYYKAWRAAVLEGALARIGVHAG